MARMASSQERSASLTMPTTPQAQDYGEPWSAQKKTAPKLFDLRGYELVIQQLIGKNSFVADNGCWIWKRFKNKQGYGFLRFRKRGMNAHRASFIAHGGSFPNGKNLVLHSCNNPSCVNPEHLRAGSYLDNSDDKIKVQHHPHGIHTKASKLDEASVHAIRSLASSGVKRESIADHYQISLSTVFRILRKESWKHI